MIVTLGLEPTAEFYPRDDTASTSAICEKCRAAPALHSGRSTWLDLASVDANLLSVVLAWDKISEPIRKMIVQLAMIQGSQCVARFCCGSRRRSM